MGDIDCDRLRLYLIVTRSTKEVRGTRGFVDFEESLKRSVVGRNLFERARHREARMANLFTDLEAGPNPPEEITVVVECLKGDRNKY